MADEPLFPHLSPSAEPSRKPAPDLFQDAPVSAAPMAGSGMVESVVSTKDAKEQQILGPKPKVSSALNIGADEFNLGGLLFKLSLVAGLLVYGFFYVQLNSSLSFLSHNPVQTLASFESSFETDQTEINFYNLLMAKFALDDFMTSSDAFLLKWAQYQSSHTANNVREDLIGELGTLQEQMKASLSKVKVHVSPPLYPQFLATAGTYSIQDLEQKYELLLTQKVQDATSALGTNTDVAASIEKSNLESVQALANDKAFRRELKALNLEEHLTPEIVESLFVKSTQVNKNLFATILQVKNNRVNWPKVIAELKRVTKKVDPLYGTTIQSNIDYSNLAVNAADFTITIRGETRTDDSLNFSLLSNLIDELEKSTLFSNVSNRTFSKAGSIQDTVTSSFNLSFSLQNGEDPRDELSGLADLKSVPFPLTTPTVTAEISGDVPYGAAELGDGAEDETDEMTVELLTTTVDMTVDEEEAPTVEPDSFSPLGLNVMKVFSPVFGFVHDLFDGSKNFQSSVLDAKPRIPRTPRNQR